MLDVLMHNEMQDILAVVVRYFGGIKLGTGGLVRAYSSSISQALKVATLTTVTTFQEYQIHFSYDLIGKIDHYFRTQNIEVIEQQYEEDVVYHFLVLNDSSRLSENTEDPRKFNIPWVFSFCQNLRICV